MASDPRRDAFLSGLSGESASSAAGDATLQGRLDKAIANARAAWPTLELDETAFVRHVAEHVDGEAAPCGILDDLCIGDLFLAFACAAGTPRALELLESRYFVLLDGPIARMRLGDAQIDDIKQTLRQQLLVASETGPPRIAQYGGRGALAAWLRVSAVRAALKLVRSTRREVAADEDDDLFALPSTENTPELARFKREHQGDFRTAFLGALAALSDRDKNLLRQHHLDGLSVDELAALYKVHRATAARWVAAARQALLASTRAALLEGARLQPGDCDSIMRLAHSQLDVTLRRLLG